MIRSERYNNLISEFGFNQIQETISHGEIIFTRMPQKYNLLGIGSCLAIFIYDLTKKRYTLAHTLLPKRRKLNEENNENIPGKFTDQAIITMVRLLEKKGSARGDLKAKFLGGASIYDNFFQIGKYNVIVAKEVLNKLKLPLIAYDTGGNFNRSILKFDEAGTILYRKRGKLNQI